MILYPPIRAEHFGAYSERVQWTPAEIKRRRIVKGFKSQEALAEALGVSRKAVSNWETGEAEPRGINLRQLERVLGDAPEDDVPLRSASLMQLHAEQGRRIADLEAELQALRTEHRPQHGRHADFPDHLFPPQSTKRRNSDR